MRYYVIAPDGQRYGPAEVSTLNEWAAEGRLLPTQMVEDETSGVRTAASSLEGLIFPAAAPSTPVTPPAGYSGGQPYQQHYARPGYAGDDGSKDMNQAWIFGVLGFFCCGLIFGILGLQAANRAQAKGHPSANAARILNIIVLVLWGLGLILNIGLMAFGSGR